MKRMTGPRIALIAAIIIGVIAGFTVQKVKAQQVRIPMLFQTYLQDPDANGNLQTSLVLTDAVRSDGSWSQDAWVPTQNVHTHIVALMPTHQIFHYNPRLNMRTERHFSDDLYARYAGPLPNDCIASHPGAGVPTCVDSGQTMLGYHVMKLSRAISLNDGSQEQTEELVAPDLDWRTLSYTLTKAGKVVEVRTVLFVTVGEPASGLFSVPNDLPLVSGTQYNQSLRGE